MMGGGDSPCVLSDIRLPFLLFVMFFCACIFLCIDFGRVGYGGIRGVLWYAAIERLSD